MIALASDFHGGLEHYLSLDEARMELRIEVYRGITRMNSIAMPINTRRLMKAGLKMVHHGLHIESGAEIAREDAEKAAKAIKRKVARDVKAAALEATKPESVAHAATVDALKGVLRHSSCLMTKTWLAAECVNDFATPCFINLRCRVVLFQWSSFVLAVG